MQEYVYGSPIQKIYERHRGAANRRMKEVVQ